MKNDARIAAHAKWLNRPVIIRRPALARYDLVRLTQRDMEGIVLRINTARHTVLVMCEDDTQCWLDAAQVVKRFYCSNRLMQPAND